VRIPPRCLGCQRAIGRTDQPQRTSTCIVSVLCHDSPPLVKLDEISKPGDEELKDHKNSRSCRNGWTTVTRTHMQEREDTTSGRWGSRCRGLKRAKVMDSRRPQINFFVEQSPPPPTWTAELGKGFLRRDSCRPKAGMPTCVLRARLVERARPSSCSTL
jgi:hypothetical protein